MSILVSSILEKARNLKSPEFSYVWRDDLDFDDHAKEFEERLMPHLIREYRASEWPGTELDELAATIRRYNLNDESAKVLSCVEKPFDFISPSYPEDLAIYVDGKLYYACCSHERFDWFE